MANTTIDLNNRLIKEAMRLSKAKTRKQVVNMALEKLIMGISQKKILSITWGNYFLG